MLDKHGTLRQPWPLHWVSLQPLPWLIPLAQEEAESYKAGDTVALALSVEGTRFPGVPGTGEGFAWSMRSP